MVHRAHRLLSGLNRILCTLRTRPRARASRSRCHSHGKRGLQRDVSGYRTWRSRLHPVPGRTRAVRIGAIGKTLIEKRLT
jgi:hypothetical protein